MIDVIALAREAGLEVHPYKHMVRVGVDTLTGDDSTAKLERFAVLIQQATAAECAALVDANADACTSAYTVAILRSNAAAIRGIVA